MISWTSSIDDALGTGGSLSATTLNSGTRTITDEVTDSGGKTDSATITVIVNGSPTVLITSPADGAYKSLTRLA
jgi:hypothetical protein